MKPTKNRVYCNDCQKPKMLFSSEKKADNFISFNSKEMEEEGKYVPVRSYYCSMCGGWHVTSNPHSNLFRCGSRNERLQKRHSFIMGCKELKSEERKERDNIRYQIKCAVKSGNRKKRRFYCINLLEHLKMHPYIETFSKDIDYVNGILQDLIPEKISIYAVPIADNKIQKVISIMEMYRKDISLIVELGIDENDWREVLLNIKHISDELYERRDKMRGYMSEKEKEFLQLS